MWIQRVGIKGLGQGFQSTCGIMALLRESSHDTRNSRRLRSESGVFIRRVFRFRQGRSLRLGPALSLSIYMYNIYIYMIYIYIYMTYIYIYTYMYTCIYVYMYICICVYLYLCMCICICIYVYVYVYVYVFTLDVFAGVEHQAVAAWGSAIATCA